MKTPKPLPAVPEPVKLIFVGGFLGAGKTTALGSLAKMLIGRGKKLGIVTNDQSGNLADTLIVRQMIDELSVPVEEVVSGCFCCKFDELIDKIDRILVHGPDILLGEPVGSCTDFVAAVANPIKINYGETFVFAPFTTLVDPERMRELLLAEIPTPFPEEVAYLFGKQLEEADIIVLNKVDMIAGNECRRLMDALKERYPRKEVLAVSARNGQGMETWLEQLVSGRPSAGTVLTQVDYDRYAKAEAVLGWLNAAVKITSNRPFEPEALLERLIRNINDAFCTRNACIGHLKLALTSQGQTQWANITHSNTEPTIGGKPMGEITGATLLINARVQMTPEKLEADVRTAVFVIATQLDLGAEILELQCFSPAYPNPPYLMR
jgi:G3E family GTPase